MATLSGLQPWLRPHAEIAVTYAARYGGKVTSTYRSWSEQYSLWVNRSRNPYPVAPPGRSMHQYGRAFDIVAPLPVLHQLGAWWRSIGGRWNPSDAIHFEA